MKKIGLYGLTFLLLVACSSNYEQMAEKKLIRKL